MRTVYAKHGRQSRTMPTVGELIDMLSQHPRDALVSHMWNGMLVDIDTQPTIMPLEQYIGEPQVLILIIEDW